MKLRYERSPHMLSMEGDGTLLEPGEQLSTRDFEVLMRRYIFNLDILVWDLIFV